jgi:transcriptional regulator with XRE-family HTH domain
MVIQAQLKRRRDSRSQRRDARRTMQLVAPGRTARGQAAEVRIHDLSTGGLLVETDADLTVGETFEVVLPRTGAREAEVVWKSGSFSGCRFLQPVPPGAVSAAMLQSAPASPTDADYRSEETPAGGFGERLTALRVAKDWSLETLAERLGVSRQAVWYWETGQRLPRAEHFRTIAELFAVPEAELLARKQRAPRKDSTTLIGELKREVARLHGVAESAVRVLIEF